jgi:hypothetical protein
MTPRMRRLYARRDALLKQIESIDLEIRDMERETGMRASRLLRKRPARLRR